MFTKILIANRGEIACRVIATARKMGIATVAVYSDADKDARHVQLADEAVHIGAAPSRESYLLADRIIAACKQTGAQAVHPGYGFLSENEGFARRVEEEGIVFIGPKHHAIAAMGDKIASKKLAAEAKVNTIPGYNDAISGPEQAVEIARGIGYPVMIKASAGGGGKGLRVAFNDKEAFAGFASCQNEARNTLGDDRAALEIFVEEPRHIEIQVLGDAHGNVVFLNERECSIQRRHQKVIEEAPSPFISEETRAAMGAQAVALAKAVQYQSAGTVEFVVGKDQSFYFLEMNTRLQVEHPVTEAITGLDLVEQMIRVAAGEKLSFTQADVRRDGWAIECRINAEDPFRNFLPSPGRLVRFQPPAQTMWQGETDFNTGFIAAHYGSGFHAEDVPHSDPQFLVALAAYMNRRYRERASTITGQMQGHEVQLGLQYTVVTLGAEGRNQHASVRVEDFDLARHASKVTVQAEGGDKTYEISSASHLRDARLEGVVNGKPFTVQIERGTGKNPLALRIAHNGTQIEALVLSPRGAELHKLMPYKAPPDLSKFLLSPMPGLLIDIAVQPGQKVQAGEKLAVIEAMKMENILFATQDGVVGKISASKGDSLAVDEVILEFV